MIHPLPIEAGLLPWLLAAVALTAGIAPWVRLRRRNEMIARACHEIRGPLTAARLALATMERRAEGPAERLAGLDLELRRAGLALDDFAAARSGRRTVDRVEPVEVADLLEEQAETWAAVARAYRSDVRLGALLDGSFVRGDRIRLAQAVSNLVANALEHGQGTIELCAREIGAQHVRIEVVDEGPGLPASVADLVSRPRAGRGRRGRGLAIAADIARRHGGRIAAVSTTAGAGVGLELPLMRRAG